MIFWVSAASVGMNLKAMDIIMAISWTGTLMTCKGEKSFSSASLILRGVVVSVRSTLVDTIRNISLIAIIAARLNPYPVIVIIFQENKTSPCLIVNTLITKMNSAKGMIGLIVAQRTLGVIFAIMSCRMMTPASTAIVTGSLIMKIATRYTA